jgi:hypothetical protein
LHDHNEHVLAFARVSDSPKKRIAVVANTNYTSSENTTIKLDTSKKQLQDLLSKKKLSVKDGHLHVALHAGECLVFEY